MHWYICMTFFGQINNLFCYYSWGIIHKLINLCFQLIIVIWLKPSFPSYLLPNMINNTGIFAVRLDFPLSIKQIRC